MYFMCSWEPQLEYLHGYCIIYGATQLHTLLYPGAFAGTYADMKMLASVPVMNS